jgi:hypothetical protein
MANTQSPIASLLAAELIPSHYDTLGGDCWFQDCGSGLAITDWKATKIGKKVR